MYQQMPNPFRPPSKGTLCDLSWAILYFKYITISENYAVLQKQIHLKMHRFKTPSMEFIIRKPISRHVGDALENNMWVINAKVSYTDKTPYHNVNWSVAVWYQDVISKTNFLMQ